MRWLLPVVACLALVQLSGCAERSFEPIQSAGWKPGYMWGYAMEGSIQGSISFSEDGKVVEEEQYPGEMEDLSAQTAYRVLNTELQHDGKPVYLVAVAGSNAAMATPIAPGLDVGTDSTHLLGFLQSTLEPLGVSYSLVDCDRCPAGIREPNTLRFHDVPTYPWVKFPLKQHDTWAGDLMGMVDSGQRMQSSVRGMLTVDGPGDVKVDAIRVSHTLDVSGLELLKKEALEEAEREGIKVNAFDVSQTITSEVLYAPSLHNVLAQTTYVSSYMHLDFEEDGHHRVGDMQLEGTVTTRLVSYDLTEGPQVPLEGLGKALEVPIDLPAVPGQEPTGSLRITADRSVVNAAEEPSVRFTTQVAGNATADSYTLYDASGDAIAAGKGGDFTFKVKEPGTYKATVVGDDGNGRTLRSSTEVVADYQLTVPANCGLANVLGFPNCDALDLPVRPGIQWLEVKATRAPLAVEPGYGSLQLYDGQGSYESDGMSGNEASITIDSFDDRMFGEDWELQYYPYVGVLEDVEYTVTLLHSQDGPGSGPGSFFDTLFEDATSRLAPGLFGLPA